MAIIVYDEIFLEHDTGKHPECAERLANTVQHLHSTGLWDECTIHTPREATVEELEAVHFPAHVKKVREMSAVGGGYFDMDTPVSARSYEAALKAAGGVMDAVDFVMADKDKTALCLVRPPGHHATPFLGMGFCLFNNIAVAAAYAMDKHNLERIFIMDFDVHHGNGTQEIFYAEPRVMFCSTHRAPFYPGSGSKDETGDDKGKGFTVNLPMDYGITPDEYLAELDGVLEGVADKFKPELVMISAGFDGIFGTKDDVTNLN